MAASSTTTASWYAGRPSLRQTMKSPKSRPRRNACGPAAPVDETRPSRRRASGNASSRPAGSSGGRPRHGGTAGAGIDRFVLAGVRCAGRRLPRRGAYTCRDKSRPTRPVAAMPAGIAQFVRFAGMGQMIHRRPALPASSSRTNACLRSAHPHTSAAAFAVEVLDAQYQRSTVLAAALLRLPEGRGMPEVEVSRRGRSQPSRDRSNQPARAAGYSAGITKAISRLPVLRTPAPYSCCAQPFKSSSLPRPLKRTTPSTFTTAAVTTGSLLQSEMLKT